MIKSVIEQVKEAKKLAEETVNIPLTYVLFLVSCFLMWKPEYIELINVSKWVPNNIEKIILGILNLVYSHFISISVSIYLCLLLVMFLSEKTRFFNKILPKDVEYTNNTTVIWSEYNAIKRLILIFIRMITQFWVYYFMINILFNPYKFSENFFIIKENFQYNNELVINNYLTEDTLAMMNILFIVNALCAVYFVLRALFEIRTTTNDFYLKSEDMNHFIKINSFIEIANTKEMYETSILKNRFRKKSEYLLVNVQLSERKLESFGYKREQEWVINEIPYGKRVFEIINSADNLSDIIYHFEALKENTSSNKSIDG